MRDFNPDFLVNFAHDILSMNSTINNLQREVARLEKIEQEYNDLLKNSMQHSQDMMGNLLTACMALGDKGVEKAFGGTSVTVDTSLANIKQEKIEVVDFKQN